MIRQVQVSGCGNPDCKWNDTGRAFWQDEVGPGIYPNHAFVCVCGFALTPIQIQVATGGA